MTEISASLVRDLRELTGLGMMECKRALTEAGGDIRKAEELLRIKSGAKANKAAGRIAAEGVIGTFLSADGKLGVLVELNCETDFVARNDAFRGMATDLIKHILSTSEAAAELLTQKFVLNPAHTVKEALMELNARTGENVALPRTEKFALTGPGRVDSYVHHDNKSGAMVELACGSKEQAATEEVKQLAKDLALQVVASNPLAIDRDGVPANLIQEQREIIAKIMENDPANAKKPEQIQTKIAEGMLNKWFAENNLLDQPFAKDPAQGSVADVIRKVASATGGTPIKVNRVTRYVLGETASPEGEAGDE